MLIQVRNIAERTGMDAATVYKSTAEMRDLYVVLSLGRSHIAKALYPHIVAGVTPAARRTVG